MSIIRQHSTSRVYSIAGGGTARAFCPGELVGHREDEKSLGMVVASTTDDVTVLWSRLPVGTIDMMELQSEVIVAKSRRLKAKWKGSEAEPVLVGDFEKLKEIFGGPAK